MKKLLEGVRVIEAANIIAGPFATGLLADFGAEVIKIEMPGVGDPFRSFGPFHEGESIRWPHLGRNKKSITLDLHFEEGKKIFLDLIAKSDLLVENFRTGTLDKWGLSMEELKKANPNIVVVRITGYGQTGPYKFHSGFGTPLTAFSGMTYITGYPDRPPVSPAFSIADFIAGLNGAMAGMMALYHRDALKGKAQEVDISLYEGIFRMQELMISEYFTKGIIKERKPGLSGATSPCNTFQTKDGKWVVIVCSTDRTFEYLTKAMNREDLMEKYSKNADRLRDNDYMEEIVSNWTQSLNYEELKEAAEREGVPASLIYSMEDIANDPQYEFRENILEMPHDTFGTIKMPGIVPKFSETPGSVEWIGPELGEHNEEVYKDFLGLTQDEMKDLKEKKII